MRPKPYSRSEATFLIGVPLAWGVLLLFHPTGDEYYDVISDSVTPWLVVHLGTMLFIPLLAAAMFVLLRGIEGTAATVSRIALVVFAIVYAGFEVTVGVGSGVLGDAINALPAAERAVGAEVLTSYNDSGVITVLSTIGSLAWLVAVAAAGLALFRRARTASSIAVGALFLVSAPGIVIHVTPFGPAGLALFIVALLLVMRATAVPVARPRVAPRGVASVHEPDPW
jgi:hypothetical protein